MAVFGLIDFNIHILAMQATSTYHHKDCVFLYNWMFFKSGWSTFLIEYCTSNIYFSRARPTKNKAAWRERGMILHFILPLRVFHNNILFSYDIVDLGIIDHTHNTHSDFFGTFRGHRHCRLALPETYPRKGKEEISKCSKSTNNWSIGP